MTAVAVIWNVVNAVITAVKVSVNVLGTAARVYAITVVNQSAIDVKIFVQHNVARRGAADAFVNVCTEH